MKLSFPTLVESGWSPCETPFGFTIESKPIAALAVDLTHAEVAYAASVNGHRGLAEMVEAAFALLESGAIVARDKWLDENSGVGLTISLLVPPWPGREAKFEPLPGSSEIQIPALLMASHGSLKVTRERVETFLLVRSMAGRRW